MIGLIICAAVLAANPPTDSTPPATYAEARSRAGRAPDDQVRLALWCEAHGLAAERLHHLTLAVLADPKNATARGLMGLVAYQDRWLRPESVADRTRAEPSLAEYEARRLKAPETADGQMALGIWADDHGLKDQARAHLTLASRLDPSKADAWKRLGFIKHDGRWVTHPQLAAEKVEIEAQQRADRKWKPLLEKYRLMVATPSRRVAGEAGLAEVTDPRAVPSIGRVFATTPDQEPIAVRLLGQIDALRSTRALAYLAIFGRSVEARRAATETLRNRDPREFADLLIALLANPIRFEVKHVDGLDSPGEMLVEGKRVNVRRLYVPPPVFRPDDQLSFDETGRPVVLRHVGTSSTQIRLADLSGTAGVTSAEARSLLLEEMGIGQELGPGLAVQPDLALVVQYSDTATIPLAKLEAEARKSTQAAERQLRQDVRKLEDYNFAVRTSNERVASVLKDATRQSLPAEQRPWMRWWVDQLGYASGEAEWTYTPSVDENVSIAYQSPTLPDGSYRPIVSVSVTIIPRDCFGAGTPIRTITGPRPIEEIRVGDRVLTQDARNGNLGYRPVLGVHRTSPSATVRINLQGEPIVASHFHRFWVAGQGWVMARDLKAGDPIRTLGGVAPIESIEADAVQLVYNLDVADDADFFAGNAAALVHDNTLPDPRLAPFDASQLAKK